MESYLDNSATTRVYEEVILTMTKIMREDYGNPSSMHQKGVVAERILKDARETISKLLKVTPKEIIFTSGGTESNNLALIGYAFANKRSGNHILISGIEHASILATAKFLSENGFEVEEIPVDSNGVIILDKLEQMLRPDTILCSVMYVNNEIGSVMPIESIAELVHEKCEYAAFHVDAIQAFGKYKIFPKKQGIDMLSVSGHKLHGPKGSGFLYVKSKLKIKPIIFGGGQQEGMRSGTENVPAYAGLAVAAKKMYDNFDENVSKLRSMKQHFIEGINEMEGTHINGFSDEKSAPHIISVSFEGIRSEVFLHALEDKGVFVSAGSACSSNHPSVSKTLKGIGVKNELLDSTVRFSLNEENTIEEIDYALSVLNEIVPVLRKYRRG